MRDFISLRLEFTELLGKTVSTLEFQADIFVGVSTNFQIDEIVYDFKIITDSTDVRAGFGLS